MSTRFRQLIAATPAVLAAAAGVVVIYLQWIGARPLWVDEQMIAINIRDRAFADLGGLLWLGQSAPLGWLMLQRLVLSVAGASDLSLRFMPAMFGAATLIAAVWTGRRWMGAVGAFVLTFLCATGLWLSFFPLELKHYSADAFWGLMLPALAAWVLDASGAHRVRRRMAVWWIVAAVAHWLSNGGLLAAPGCAIVLALIIWRRHGLREALIFAAAGFVWLLSFAVYYHLSLGYTHRSGFLRSHWSREFPPAGSGPAGTVAWIASRLAPLAHNPAGASWWIALWAAAAAGFAFARSRALGLLCATAPLMAFVLAAAGFVPLYERFALWIVPSLYAGIAMLADRAALLARDARRGRRLAFLAAVPAAALAVFLTVDISARGIDDLRRARSPETNHGLNDRDSVRWLLAQRKPGDAVLTTRLGWPAIWWYGGVRPSAPVGMRPEFLEIAHRPPGNDCRPEELADALRPYTRAIVHIGFPDMPQGYDGLLLRHLDQLGAIAHYREFGHDGMAAIVDLHTPNALESTLDLIPRLRDEPRRLSGCIAVAPARLW